MQIIHRYASWPVIGGVNLPAGAIASLNAFFILSLVAYGCAHEPPPPKAPSFHRVGSAPSARIVHDNGLSEFKLVSATYLLDGQRVYHAPTGAGLLEGEGTTPVFAGYVDPGYHTLTVLLQYRPSSSLFSYAEDYLYRVTSSSRFVTADGKETTMIVHVEDRTLARRPEERLAVRFQSTMD